MRHRKEPLGRGCAVSKVDRARHFSAPIEWRDADLASGEDFPVIRLLPPSVFDHLRHRDRVRPKRQSTTPHPKEVGQFESGRVAHRLVNVETPGPSRAQRT